MTRRELLYSGSAGVLATTSLSSGSALPPTLEARQQARAPFRLRPIPLGYTTYRLRDIHLDDDGEAWIGANEPDRHIPVVNLATEKCRKADMNLGDKQYLDMVLPIGEKIVVCGGGYAKQVILQRKSGKRIEKPMTVPNPLIYGGTIADSCAYLFDCQNGIYRWDTKDDSSAFYPYTGVYKPLVGGMYVRQNRSLYGVPWWQEGMPLATPLVRFDTQTGKYAGEFTAPWEAVRMMPPAQVGEQLYMTDMFAGYLMVFDIKTERWTARYRLPEYGKSWVYTTACAALGPYLLCNTSTFQGVKAANGTYGFDGQRHHFVNKVIVFDTRDASASLVDIPSLSGKGYATIAYLRTLRGKIYGTCVDSTIQPDGKPNEQGPAYLTEFVLQDREPGGKA